MRGLLLMDASSATGSLLVVLFLILFLALIVKVYRKSARLEMNRGALLPLEDQATQIDNK
jgi:cbb3-type cytochrome oxidase subunit 3